MPIVFVSFTLFCYTDSIGSTLILVGLNCTELRNSVKYVICLHVFEVACDMPVVIGSK